MNALTEFQLMPKPAAVPKLPSKRVLSLSVNGIVNRLKKEKDPAKRYRLRAIKEELNWLIDQL